MHPIAPKRSMMSPWRGVAHIQAGEHMNPLTRRCGHTRCNLPPQDRPCQLDAGALTAVPSTLLVPLAARALGSRHFPWLNCHDVEAAHLLQCLNVNPQPYLADAPTVLNILWRTREFKAIARAFFERWPQALGVNLGSGLSCHFQWLDTGQNHWIDADLPAVHALRDTLLPSDGHARWHNHCIDLCQPDWWNKLNLPTRRTSATPVLLLCEGVLMYLQPTQVAAVLHTFAQRAPTGSLLVLDTLSAIAIGRARLHASIGRTGAEFHWGVRHANELSAAHPRLRLHAWRSVSECYGLTAWATETWWRPWLGAPLYGLATLALAD